MAHRVGFLTALLDDAGGTRLAAWVIASRWTSVSLFSWQDPGCGRLPRCLGHDPVTLTQDALGFSISSGIEMRI